VERAVLRQSGVSRREGMKRSAPGIEARSAVRKSPFAPPGGQPFRRRLCPFPAAETVAGSRMAFHTRWKPRDRRRYWPVADARGSDRLHIRRQRSPMLALTDAQLQIVMATAAAVLPSD